MRAALGPESPINEYQALMECAPFQQPDTHVGELLHLRDTLSDAIDQLTPLEREVFNMSCIERVGCRRIGNRLESIGLPNYSKSGVMVVRDRAIAKLQALLKDNPEIIEYLKGQSNGEMD